MNRRRFLTRSTAAKAREFVQQRQRAMAETLKARLPS